MFEPGKLECNPGSLRIEVSRRIFSSEKNAPQALYATTKDINKHSIVKLHRSNILSKLRAPRPIRRLQRPPQRTPRLLRIRALRRTQMRCMSRKRRGIIKRIRIVVRVADNRCTCRTRPNIHLASAYYRRSANVLAHFFRRPWATVGPVFIDIERRARHGGCTAVRELLGGHAFAECRRELAT
jgi:hypothetical protein